MTTMIVSIESGANTRNITAAMRQLKGVLKVKVQRKTEAEFNLYDSLDRAFADVRLMLDGKKREKTAQEFLKEIRDNK
jgi:hypothetical protein